MNVINSVVLSSVNFSNMLPLAALIICVGGILMLIVKWVFGFNIMPQLNSWQPQSTYYSNKVRVIDLSIMMKIAKQNDHENQAESIKTSR